METGPPQHTPISHCDACSTQQGPLLKLSLGKDFFGRSYDRLSPSSDRNPKWYCESCSMHKNFQRDLRDINDEITKRDAGETSALHDQDQVVRAQLRLREIALLLDTTQSPFFRKEEVGALIRALEPAFGATEAQADGRSA